MGSHFGQFPAFNNRLVIFLSVSLPFTSFFSYFSSILVKHTHSLTTCVCSSSIPLFLSYIIIPPSHTSSQSDCSSVLLPNYQWLGFDRYCWEGWQWVCSPHPPAGRSNSWPLETIALANHHNIQTPHLTGTQGGIDTGGGRVSCCIYICFVCVCVQHKMCVDIKQFESL